MLLILSLLLLGSLSCIAGFGGVYKNSRRSTNLALFRKRQTTEEKAVEIVVKKEVAAAPTTATFDYKGVPVSGIIDYSGNTTRELGPGNSYTSPQLTFVKPTFSQETLTKWNLWRQAPWKKISSKNNILKIKVGGSLSLESSPPQFSFGPKDFDSVDSVQDLFNLFAYGAHDPRVKGIFLDIDRLNCGYAKLIELRRVMSYFTQSGKKIYGYITAGAEKEVYLGLGCSQLYIPPDSGGLDLRGFVGAATFVRGVFDKIGIEPQVQRIGKYKSFGDTFNRTSISEAQREVVSSLLMESSDFWVRSVAERLNISEASLYDLWNSSSIPTSYDFKSLGLVTGVKYLDAVEALIKRENKVPTKTNPLFNLSSFVKKNETVMNITSEINAFVDNYYEDYVRSDYDIEKEFTLSPRRTSADVRSPIKKFVADLAEKYSVSELLVKKVLSTIGKREALAEASVRIFPGGLYLRKMRRAARIISSLPLKETRGGLRIAIINAEGGIQSGKSGSSGLSGRSLGSESLISLVRIAKQDPTVAAVVLRIDSPGGSALASDQMWKEIRSLSYEKPVVASMSDVAASGGYYIAMACDRILAEDLTVTGSIGVVTSKFNLQELNSKIGFTSDTISRGRFAEILSSSRGFTEEEDAYFAAGAQVAYKSFVSKAARSRSMSYEALQEVAQGRVWTGQQAKARGLVDDIGGLHLAISIAADLANATLSKDKAYAKNGSIRVQTLSEARGGFALPFGGGRSAAAADDSNDAVYLCDDSVAFTKLAAPEVLGIGKVFSAMGINDMLASYNLKKVDNSILKLVEKSLDNGGVRSGGAAIQFFRELFFDIIV